MRSKPIVIFFPKGSWSGGLCFRGSQTALQKSLEDHGFIYVEHGSSAWTMLVLVLITTVLGILSKSVIVVLILSLILVYTVLMILGTTGVSTVLEASRFVKRIIEENPQTSDFIIAGEADGAHVASLLCTNLFFLERQNVDHTLIKGSFFINGVFSDKLLDPKMLKRVFGTTGPQYYHMFPIYNIRADTTPPTFNICQTGDLQAFSYHFALLQAGVWAELCYHNTKDYKSTTEFIVRFICDCTAE